MSDCNVVSTFVTPLQGKSTVHLNNNNLLLAAAPNVV